MSDNLPPAVQDVAQRVERILKQVDSAISAGPCGNDWDSIRANFAVPDWYQNAKLGIFIHWGPYSVPAFNSEWYPRDMYIPSSSVYAHHRAVFGPQDRFGYKDFIPKFKAEHFDASAWAKLFRDAGAKFVVPVAEHHDGFAMYDTQLSRWNAKLMGLRRDIIGELASAIRQQGMVLGLSSHRAEHWWYYNGGMTAPSDVQDPNYADLYAPARSMTPTNSTEPGGPDAEFLDNWLARTAEFIDKYQPALIWFDWWIEQINFHPYLRRLAAFYYNRGKQWNQGVALNYKIKAFPEGTAIFDMERSSLKGTRPVVWQNDTAVSRNSWGHISHNDYKTATILIQDLIDVTSKNGVLLLNVGPRPDGTIPEPEQKILLDIGNWLKTNGPAIYGSRPWKIYGEGPTEVAEGHFTDSHRKPFTPQDIRFTTRDNKVYAMLLGWPGEEAVIHSLGEAMYYFDAPIASVRLLGCDQKLTWSRNAGELRVKLPATPPNPNAHVLEIVPANR